MGLLSFWKLEGVEVGVFQDPPEAHGRPPQRRHIGSPRPGDRSLKVVAQPIKSLAIKFVEIHLQERNESMGFIQRDPDPPVKPSELFQCDPHRFLAAEPAEPSSSLAPFRSAFGR